LMELKLTTCRRLQDSSAVGDYKTVVPLALVPHYKTQSTRLVREYKTLPPLQDTPTSTRHSREYKTVVHLDLSRQWDEYKGVVGL